MKVVLLLALGSGFLIMATKDSSRTGAKRKNPPDVNPARFRTTQDWLDLNHEVLILHCNALNLVSTGSHATLVERLFNLYNTGRSQQPQISSGEPISTSLITSLALSSHVGYPLPSVILSTSTASINSPLCNHRSVSTTPPAQDFQHQDSSSISSSITPVIAQIVRNVLQALLQAQEATNSSSVPISQSLQQQQNPFQQPPTPSSFNLSVQQGEHPLTQQIRANITSPCQKFPTLSNLFQHQPPAAQSDELPALPSRILDPIRRDSQAPQIDAISRPRTYTNFDRSVAHLRGARSRLYTAALAPNTISTYQVGVHSFYRFCSAVYVSAFPLTEVTLEYYVVSTRRVSYRTVKVYLCGIQFVSTLLGFNVRISDMRRLHYFLRGVRRSQGSCRLRPNRLHITLSHIRLIFQYVDNFHDRLMYRSAVTLAF